MVEVVLTLQGRDLREGRPPVGPEVLAGSLGGGARQGFEFGEHPLNGIEGGTVRGQKHAGSPPLLNELRPDRILVDGEIIQDAEVARVERRA